MQPVALLGPQRLAPNRDLAPTLATAVGELALAGPLALVTAGSQERESEDDELRSELPETEITNLELYARGERLFETDPELAALARHRQGRLRRLQALYRRRLDHAQSAVRELERVARREGDEADPLQDILDGELESALEAVRQLDRHHLDRVAAIWKEYEEEAADRGGPLAEQRAELSEIIASSSAVLVAGGHVAVLVNRLRLFGLKALLGTRPVIAWSAGAMALAERIVLFHDSPPWGAGNSEVLDRGEGLFSGLLPLPHASQRLRLESPRRVRAIARRNAPAICLGLDPGSQALLRNGSWSVRGAVRLHDDGSVEAVGGDPVGRVDGPEDWEVLKP